MMNIFRLTGMRHASVARHMLTRAGDLCHALSIAILLHKMRSTSVRRSSRRPPD
jgi:hypothetical protein